MDELLAQLKSLKEATTEEVQGVFKRYEQIHACGTAQNNEVFLHQQGLSSVSIETLTIETKELQGLCEERGIKWDERYKGRVKMYRASDESVDSCGDIIKQDGWDFTRFKTNPVIPWCHDYYVMPVGQALKWKVQNGALMIAKLFALEEQCPWSEMTFKMIDAGFLRGCSVGFIPKKVMSIQDEEERKKLGLGKYGVLFVKSMLLESSICPIGCNPAALVQDDVAKALKRGIVSHDDVRRVQDSTTPGAQVSDTLKLALDRAMLLVKGGVLIVPGTDVPESTESNTEEDTHLGKAVEFDMESVYAKIREIVEGFKPNNEEAVASAKTLIDKIDQINTKLVAIDSDLASVKASLAASGEGGSSSLTPELNDDLAGLMLGLKDLKNALPKKE